MDRSREGLGHQIFEPLVRGGSCSFQLPVGVGHSIFKMNRHTFICQPAGEMSLEKEIIQAFSEKYAADQDLVVKYIHDLAYLNMMKQKRERGRRENAERESIT